MPELERLPIVSDSPLFEGCRFHLHGPNLFRLRYRQVRGGEAFTLADANRQWFRARVEAYRPDLAECVAFERMPLPPEPPITITLVQAVPARERMFWIVQKATELGVDRIVPVTTARSVAPAHLWREKPQSWWPAILRAVRQCRRATVPALEEATTLEQALSAGWWLEAQIRWVLAGPDSPPPPPGQPTGVSQAAIAVGPEGGWSPQELVTLTSSGAQPVALTGRTLRTETAAIVGLAALLALYGDLRPL
jgi:16S rRNA (uracil1498-N3)-methyltransferase